MITENELPGRDDLHTPSRETSERNEEGLPGGGRLSTDETEDRNASSDEDTDDLETEVADTEEEDDEPALDEEDLEENKLSDEEADNVDWEPRR